MISTGFTFDGIHSDDMGMMIVRTEGGLIPVPYASAKNIIEEKVTRIPTPYFFRASLEPMTFSLTFSLKENEYWTEQKKYAIANWLFKPYYKEFISDDYADKIFYVMATNMVEFITDGNENGYIKVDFRCKNPYALTPILINDFDLSDNTTTDTILLTNQSNIGLDYYYPELEITVVSPSTSFSLTNVNDNSRVVSFTGLSGGEKIYLNNEKKQIISSTGNYRFGSWNKNWFRLVPGDNSIIVAGRVIIQVRCQFPIYI